MYMVKWLKKRMRSINTWPSAAWVFTDAFNAGVESWRVTQTIHSMPWRLHPQIIIITFIKASFKVTEDSFGINHLIRTSMRLFEIRERNDESGGDRMNFPWVGSCVAILKIIHHIDCRITMPSWCRGQVRATIWFCQLLQSMFHGYLMLDTHPDQAKSPMVDNS